MTNIIYRHTAHTFVPDKFKGKKIQAYYLFLIMKKYETKMNRKTHEKNLLLKNIKKKKRHKYSSLVQKWDK